MLRHCDCVHETCIHARCYVTHGVGGMGGVGVIAFIELAYMLDARTMLRSDWPSFSWEPKLLVLKQNKTTANSRASLNVMALVFALGKSQRRQLFATGNFLVSANADVAW